MNVPVHAWTGCLTADLLWLAFSLQLGNASDAIFLVDVQLVSGNHGKKYHCEQKIPCFIYSFYIFSVPWQMGHMPQEDYAEAIQKTISNFLRGIKE